MSANFSLRLRLVNSCGIKGVAARLGSFCGIDLGSNCTMAFNTAPGPSQKSSLVKEPTVGAYAERWRGMFLHLLRCCCAKFDAAAHDGVVHPSLRRENGGKMFERMHFGFENRAPQSARGRNGGIA
jgi:hypothetical protein